MQTSGIEAVLRILAESGTRFLFGNPGTTELPLSDALLEEQRIRYILGLQEIPVMAMADGYAQASGHLGVVNLHTCCGLGNAMGMLYNAYRGNVPLLVTAGQQDQRLMFEEPILWGDMVSVARPWTKWAHEVRRAEDVSSAVRRAVKTALTPPTGPVFLSLPLDVQMQTAELDVAAAFVADARVQPPPESIRRAVDVLATAQRPAILAGCRVQEAGAVEALVSLAEAWGAPVIQENSTTHGRSVFPADHDLFGGFLPFWSPETRDFLSAYDVLLVVGMKLFQQYIYHEPNPMPEGIKLVHVDEDPWELGKNHRVDAGVLGHPRETLRALEHELGNRMSNGTPAKERRAALAEANRRRRQTLRREASAQLDARPLPPLALMETLARILPDNVAVIEESPTTTACYLERSGALRNTSGYFAQRGWALGWGLGCAIGVKLAWPDRPVLGIIGDGSALYGIQALWTAAHYRLPVVFVLTNNRQYKILKDCAKVLRLPHAVCDEFVGMDLCEPEIDYVGLARSLGVEAHRVTEPDELAERIRAGWAGGAPLLLEVPITAAKLG